MSVNVSTRWCTSPNHCCSGSTHAQPHTALIHLPTRYYRDTVEKNAESRLADKRPGLNLNTEEKPHNTALGDCYITLQQDSAIKATYTFSEKRLSWCVASV